MENKELFKEYNRVFIDFVLGIDEGVQMLLSKKKGVATSSVIKGEEEYPINVLLDLVEDDIQVTVQSNYPYANEIVELFQFYVDWTYNSQIPPQGTFEPDMVLNSDEESFFKELVRQSDEEDAKSFAIGCPDDQMSYLKKVAEYINKQDGWSAYIDDRDILLVERV